MEDLAYRRMLDLYYTTEAPLPDAKKTARLIGMQDHVAEVESVLSDFFVTDGESWAHKRCEAKSPSSRTSRANQRRPEGLQATPFGLFNTKCNGCSTDVRRTFNGR